MEITIKKEVTETINVELPKYIDTGYSCVKIISEDTYIQVSYNNTAIKEEGIFKRENAAHMISNFLQNHTEISASVFLDKYLTVKNDINEYLNTK